MARIIIVIFSLLYLSCKKEKSPAPLDSNNQLNATVILLSGETVKINAVGSKAKMGCGILGGGTFLWGTDEMDRAVILNVYSNSSCVNGPGTYAFRCEYRTNVSSQNAPIYSNSFAADHGSITFTTPGGNYAEGHFYAICRYLNDSVVVQGTFKGYIPY